ncbi:hypothetical protein GGR51DRAFT_565318 [Nemania sp. FL0031]|nr:hypothetical protein GGR51DRAFT_565318 [Nemania sp. FL0031]
MPTQIVAPVPVTPPRKGTRLAGSSDLFASLNATLESQGNKLSTPVRSIQERDWDVPAPPPPSPQAAFYSPLFLVILGVGGIAQGEQCIGSTQKLRERRAWVVVRARGLNPGLFFLADE